jgi:hypothetical protein
MGVAEPSRYRDSAGLERKVRSAGRPWTVGDLAMIADGQWAVRTPGAGSQARDGKTAVEGPVPDGRSVELTVEELARLLGSPFREAPRDEDGV